MKNQSKSSAPNRHYCAVCGQRRYEHRMKVVEVPVLGMSVWVCDAPDYRTRNCNVYYKRQCLQEMSSLNGQLKGIAPYMGLLTKLLKHV